MANDGKHPFCSEAWVGVARDYVESQCAGRDLSGISLRFCETFTDAPAKLATEPGNVAAWFIRIEGGEVEVARGVLAPADLTITADYETVVPLARTVFEGNPEGAEAAQQAVADATAQGKMRREGAEDAMAQTPFLAGLHDALAIHTA